MPAPSELRWVEILAQSLEFGLDVSFRRDFGIEDLDALRGRGSANWGEGGFVVRGKFDDSGFLIVGREPCIG